MGSSDGGASAATPKTHELTSKVLHFLSTANGETLGACVVGIGAMTYFVLGRVGLVLIGAVGGIVLHATWEDRTASIFQGDAAERKRRKEVGLDVVQRLLNMRRVDDLPDVSDKAETELTMAMGKDLNFAEFPPETRSALTALTDAIIRDYVKWWYSPVLPEEVLFPYSCRKVLVAFMVSMGRHVARKRPAESFLNFLTNSTSVFIVFLSEMSRALMAPGMYDRDVGEAVRIYLEDKPDSSLANLLNREQQEKKFKMVAQDVLETFLDSKTYNCEPARTFLEQILASLIFEVVLKNSSQAFWINDWIIYLLEEGEPEIMNAIDAGVGGATGIGGAKIEQIPTTISSQKVDNDPQTSKAEKEMEDAMTEVRRLNEMIAQDEARKTREKFTEDTGSTVSTDQVITPTSSQSDHHSSEHDMTDPLADSRSGEHNNASTEEAEPTPVPQRAFTSFDQILPPQNDSSDLPDPVPLTLHRAKIALYDDEKPGEKGILRSKPIIEYLIQIEPASTQHPGWMSARKYTDFETLHEFTSRVAKISGIASFSQRHPSAPTWKGKNKATLRQELELYLQDALSHEGLAESEGMKRFLEKEKALGRPEPSKGVLGFPTPETFQNMGKGMLDVMSAAPKGVAGGSQALFKGVSGVFSGGSQKRTSSTPLQSQNVKQSNSSTASFQYESQQHAATGSATSFQSGSSQDMSSAVSDAISNEQPPPLPSRPLPEDTITPSASLPDNSRPKLPSRSVSSSHPNGGMVRTGTDDSLKHPSEDQSSSLPDMARPGTHLAASETSSAAPVDPLLNLPPPPSEMTDDYSTEVPRESSLAKEANPVATASVLPDSPLKIGTTDDIDPVASSELSTPPKPKSSTAQANPPLTEDETQIAIELLFAVINELYTLSSAWQIRRTLLNTAKTFLLRPGNSSLLSIRTLLQESVLDAQLSDAGIAAQLRTLRANSLPTEEEMAAWPVWPPPNEEQERMHEKARRLLVTRGLPPALTSVMGAAASAEALGRVFDALQVEEVARGLMFAMILQAIRAVTH